MDWVLVTGLLVSGYAVGWFLTAIGITQIGLPSRGCARGCTYKPVPSYDYYGSGGERRRRATGSHAPECQKPHFELCRSDQAATYAVLWPYVIFYGLLCMSERHAHEREAQRIAKKRPVDTEALDAILADEKKMLPGGPTGYEYE